MRVRRNDPEKNRRWQRRNYAMKAAWLLQHKQAPCLDCGGKFPPFVMDFDHRDPSTKSFEISHAVSGKTKAALAAEIAKCDLVCSNCHRMRTFSNRGKN